jgi:putative membrane protein insertion efficiency factor
MKTAVEPVVLVDQADAGSGRTAPRPGLAARALIVCFGVYQAARVGRVSPCRFTPTCSQYGTEAVRRYGAGRGLALTVRRLGRCRPGGPSGFDPVPEPSPPRTRDL